ncbi:hypothetical protein [Flavobacterium soyae]|uniref:hypothetical protein n=1 Tax=Flavobacterium soyae TaxID=2903098 RepID=UPI001E5F181A|nr:hypothetical protein [Flavobacterium soyae]MCD9576279.1 hypothetical protein [Flavobacterium soyae]
MIKKIIFPALLLLFIPSAFGQTKYINIPVYIKMPKDTLIANNLKNCLNGFLSEKEKNNNENAYVLKEDLLETSLLLDEIKGIEKSNKYKDENFYKGYLTNIVPLDNNNYIVQISYIGSAEGLPILGASFELLAKQKDNKFYFLSPLKRNTASWKSKKIKNCTFHFKNSLNIKTASDYVETVTLFDKKLNAPNKDIEWYGCSDLQEVLQNIGVNYKIDYNGLSFNSLNATENNTTLLVNGTNNEHFDSFDPHDLWHERVRNVIARNKINKPVDEGCAYLYGGSWGIGWKQILASFKEKIASNPNIDWLSTYDEFYNFGESREKHLLVPYVINALIIQKIEKEKGFPAVMELLSCGKYEKGNDNYFKILEKLTGINKGNYNDRVWALIKESKV